jgi:hypothetical protein
MSQENVELRAMAETAYGALNSGDLDGCLALVADDIEFTSMVPEAEGTTFRGRVIRMAGTLGGVQVAQTMWQAANLRDGKLSWWAFFRTERETVEAVGLRE